MPTDYATVNVLLVTNQCSFVSFQTWGRTADAWREAAQRVVDYDAEAAQGHCLRVPVIAVYMQEVGRDVERHTVEHLRADLRRMKAEEAEEATRRAVDILLEARRVIAGGPNPNWAANVDAWFRLDHAVDHLKAKEGR